MRSRATKKTSLHTNISQVREELETLSTVDGENNNAPVGAKEKLMEEKVNLEKELKRFYDEELELLKAGGDPLLTCKHCHHLFGSFRGYERHSCKHILQPEDGEVDHYRLLTGADRDSFLQTIDRLTTYKKLQVCITTRTAVKGIFPLLFPSKHDVSTARFGEEIGCMGEAAYSSLRQALKEDALHLPTKLVLDLPDGGGQLYLPPSLLTPRARAAGWRSRVSVEEDPGTDWMLVKAVVDRSVKMNEINEEEEDSFVPDFLSKADSEDEDDEEFLEQLGGGPRGAGARAGAGGGAGGVGSSGAARPSGAVGSGGAHISAEERRVSPDFNTFIT